MTVTPLAHLLHPDTGQPLGKIVRHAQNMGDLTQRLRDALPDEAAPQLLAANVHDDGTLVIICASSSWAARLRFENECLIAAATATGARVTHLKVRVAAVP